MRKPKRGIHLFDVFNYLFLTAAGLICVLPFVNQLAVSLSSGSAVAAGKVAFLPVEFTTSAYGYALSGGRFFRTMWNSIARTVLGTAVNLAAMILTAYPLSKTKRQVAGRNIYMTFFVITMIIGGGMIPTYLVVTRLGLKNSIWALILPGALPVYNMVILMNFMRGIPDALEEAAFIDGAAPFQVLTRVLLPIMKPALATVGLFCIISHWNDWFSGMVYLSDMDKYPLQTYLQSLLVSFQDVMRQSSTQESIKMYLQQMNARTGRAAQLFLAALPVIIVYPFLQKYFTQGLVVGSVKE